jgi:DNA-binding transcriptional LysR family regulator
MDTMLSLKVFRDVVEAGSFVAAAKRLRLSPAAVTKHVAHLEASLGARLLQRTSRQVSLTEAGAVYYDQCKDALDTLAAAAAVINGGAEAPRGVLKVTAPVWCANPFFARIMAKYREQYPDVVVDLRLENRKVDLVGEGYDLALRATREPSPTLIVKPLTDVQFYLVATPSYLGQVRRPRSLADLTKYPLIVPAHTSFDAIEFDGPHGRVSVKPQASLMTDNTTMDYHAMQAGLGIAFLPEWLVRDDIGAGRVERVLPDYVAPKVPMYAAYTSRRYLTPKVRSFIDFLSQELKSCPGESAR